MTVEPYRVSDARTMSEMDFAGPTYLGVEGQYLPAPGIALRDYLFAASRRARSSPAKVALALTLRDVWLGYSDDATSELPEAQEMITVAAATARSGESGSDASDIIGAVRRRVELVIEGDRLWRRIWSAASELGLRTGFRLDVDAARAEIAWRALIDFGASTNSFTLPNAPSGVIRALETITSRIEGTSSVTLKAIKGAWQNDSRGDASGARGEDSLPPQFPALESLRRSEVQTDGHGITVWFGTNREATTKSNPASTYRNRLAQDTLYYGRCYVSVGGVQDATGGFSKFASGWIQRLPSYGSHARVQSRERFSDEVGFTSALSAELSTHSTERTALVFIHGYRTSFDRAAISAATLSASLKHRGPTAMFSWASRASVLHYRHDESVVDRSRGQLARFLRTLGSVAELGGIDLVAHSLGNRLLLRSLVDWFKTSPPSDVPLRNLFLGAPDVAQAEMYRDAGTYARAALKTTMYGSDSDSALLASKLINGGPRAGLMPPPFLASGIDTIETSKVDSSQLRHNGLIDVPAVHADMFLVQGGHHDPSARPALHKVTAHAQPYWRFR